MEIISDKIKFSPAISGGTKLGFENFWPLFLTSIVYLLTCWIPYLNIGTTIAYTKLPVKIARGEKITPEYLFESHWFHFMGDYFILIGIMFAALVMGFCLFVVPCIVLSLAWALATLLLLDKRMNAMDALHESNRLTEGSKWQMFLVILAYCAVLGVLVWAFSAIFGGNAIGKILSIAVGLVAIPVYEGILAQFYKTLVLARDNYGDVSSE
ncbi:MAG: hypothetical protein LKK19_06290 [Bacteroidales bacterium]|jgi:uncharacterized membrane protein|nr:hypothetical protein [Bacteroidales bacterium]MCI2122295.1 hypothetical protein [Bacteroidales bacterium]MCI2145059.1 hypothetical protein [Bacteroidales bacterium]